MIDAIGVPVMADVSTLDEGLRAAEGGATFVGTTLSGYTPYTQRLDQGPDVELVGALAASGIRVVAEGRYASPADVRRAFDAGAFAVVVGGAITDPVAITRRFVAATRKR
jgi:N-acylglucosamine-6-phosphate 2-epimerase